MTDERAKEHTWVEIGPTAAIPRRGSRLVETADGTVAVFRTADNDLFALSNRCPHKGGPLSDGIVHGRRVTCPLHGWNVDLESGEATAPDDGCTTTHPIRVVDDTIYLALP